MGHELLPLAVAVNEVRLLGQMAPARRSCVQVPALILEIMSYPDQEKHGSFAAIVLQAESGKLAGVRRERPFNPFPECCTVARVYHIPCVQFGGIAKTSGEAFRSLL
jgi:hypothetical protein